MREKGQTEVAKTLETPVFSRGIEILTEKSEFIISIRDLNASVRIIYFAHLFFNYLDYNASLKMNQPKPGDFT